MEPVSQKPNYLNSLCDEEENGTPKQLTNLTGQSKLVGLTQDKQIFLEAANPFKVYTFHSTYGLF